MERDYNIKITERLRRDFVLYPNNKYEEINIFGKAKHNGKDLYILGECKVQLGKKHIDEFVKKVERISKVLKGDYFLVLVTHMPVNPKIVPYARGKGITVYRSDDFLEVGA